MKFFLPILILVTACTATKTDTAEDTLSEFEGGNFQFVNTSVSDQCLDGAFTVLFLPDGSEHNWAYPVELPSDSALPATYDIQLEEPFSVMEVSVTSGGSSGSFVIGDAVQEEVLFNADAYADCIVDLSINATITTTDSNNVIGQAILSVTEYSGETCPVFSASPCDISLDFSGYRL